MRQQQQRIDDLKKELTHTTIRHQQRIDDLKEEVSQFRKREEAGQEIFLQQFRENQKLYAERRGLDAKEDHPKRMFTVVRIGNKELEEAKTCLEHNSMLFEANAAPQSNKSDVKGENLVKEKREVGEINPFAAGMTSRHFRDKDLRENSEAMENSDIIETMVASIPTKPIKPEKRSNGRRNQICSRLPEVVVQASNISTSTLVVE